MNKVKDILEKVSKQEISVDEAYLELKQSPFDDLGFAKVDLHRRVLQGASEVIYGAGKTKEEILKISQSLLEHHNPSILITRLSKKKAKYLKKHIEFHYYKRAQIGIVGELPEIKTDGYILVATGGTSDMPVAEEAAITAEFFGNRVERVYDVGVAGIHRILSQSEKIMNATCIIVIAGMEGALASVIGGLSDCPVIAVPTSIGYGTAFNGLTTLLSMLNSCASGVSVVNIDNGFGAAYIASMINHLK